MRNAAVLALVVAFAHPLQAQEAPEPPQTFRWADTIAIPAATPWGQPIEAEATREVRSWTTMPEYTSAWVDYLPDAAAVPSPSDHFGHAIGQPGVLHKVDEIYGYFSALADASPRVRWMLLGATEEGRRLAVAMIGSEANLARLDAVKAGLRSLADPRGTSPAEADSLIATLPVVYAMTGGLHSTETGPPEMTMELAYRLAVSDDPMIRTIRDSVVVFITPVAEPDGRDRVVDWIRVNYPTADTTKAFRGPPYWGKYIMHDNNRDGLQLSARLTQELVDLFLDWRYPLGHDLHESVPYLYTSTGTGPYNATVDPVTIGEWQWFANYEVTSLTALGMPGVWTHGFYDGWNPTYLLWVTNTRNATGRFYETFGNMVPWTRERTLRSSATDVEWYRPLPPRDTTLWSLRNNTNYMETGLLAALSLSARNRSQILRQYWTKASNSLNKGRTEKPYAYVVPAAQPHRANMTYMLDLLRRQGIEVSRAAAADTFAATDTVVVHPGDWVVRMDQPYRNFILTLMQVQHFPADAPRPYDDVAWTFPLMFDVTVEAVDDPAIQQMAMTSGDEVAAPGTVLGTRPDWWLVKPDLSAYSLPARVWLGRTRVEVLEAPVALDSTEIPAGAWLVRSRDADAARMQELARRFGADVLGAPDSVLAGVRRHALDLPRIMLLHSWRSTQQEGWVRYAFDTFGIPYAYVGVDRLRASKDLKKRYDVIVFPDQGGDGRAIFAGIDPKDGPLPYQSSSDHPSLGYPDATADMTGGIGYEGLIALRDFVDEGGTFIGLRSAATLPIDMGLVRGISTTSPPGLFVPGSLVQGRVEQPASPLTYGYGSDVTLHHRFGPYLVVDDDHEKNVVVQYAPAKQLFLSGLVQNPGELADKPALITLPVGKGNYVLFGFNPIQRFQNFVDFGFLWNAILNWNDLGLGLDPKPDTGAAAVADGH